MSRLWAGVRREALNLLLNFFPWRIENYAGPVDYRFITAGSLREALIKKVAAAGFEPATGEKVKRDVVLVLGVRY